MHYDGDEWKFQRENASICVSNATKSVIEANTIGFLRLPACTPDLKPIKNLWVLVVQTLMKIIEVIHLLMNFKRDVYKKFKNKNENFAFNQQHVIGQKHLYIAECPCAERLACVP